MSREEWNRREVKFTCPKCSSPKIEEVMVGAVVVSKIEGLSTEDCGADFTYGEQTNEEGYVDRYQCGGCGFTICDDKSLHTEDGLDEDALVKAIDELNKVANYPNYLRGGRC